MLHTKRCLIIGDIMLDKYIYGDVVRISPEAPVPVVKVTHTKSTLGGAANVAENVYKLGAQVVLCGIIGDDDSGHTILEKLRQYEIPFLGQVQTARSTTTKTRIVGMGQQVVRVDEEDVSGIDDSELQQLKNNIAGILDQVDAVVVSDYRKGVCCERLIQAVIGQAKTRKIPVIVDPKEADWGKYQGADYITPNFREFREALNHCSYGFPLQNEHDSICQAAVNLLDRYELKNVLVTRSEYGMTLVSREESVSFPSLAQSVYDVSGAGDTVLAALTVFLSAGMDPKEAVNLANIAGGISVSHAGTYAVTLDEIAAASKTGHGTTESKIMEVPQLVEFIEQSRDEGKCVVFTNGCFDILHAGHVAYLQQAHELGDILIVGLNSDQSVRQLKGPDRPVNCEADRTRILAALSAVDAVVVFEDSTPYELIKTIRPDILVKGGDYSAEQVIGREFAGTTVILPFLEGRSTTGLLQKLEQNDSGR